MGALVSVAAVSLLASCSPTAPAKSTASPPTSPTAGASFQPSAPPTIAATATATATSVPKPPLPATPVPAGFAVEDLSFADGRAFALGTTHGIQMLAGSDDSGRSWRLIGRLPSGTCPAGDSSPCITRVRFGSATAGYAFRPGLMTTTDGGAHWTDRIARSDNGEAVDLAAYGPERAIEVLGSLPCGCTIRYTTDAGAHWQDTGYAPTSGGNSIDKVTMQSDISYTTQLGNTAGGGVGDAAVDASLDGGAAWHARGVPCGVALTGDVASTVGDVVGVLCIDRSAQPYVVTMRVSQDGGQTFGAAGAGIPSPFSQEDLGLASASSAAVGTSSAVLLTNDAGQHWHKVLGCGPTWLGFESATEAHAVCGNTIWRSSDGGASWQNYTFH